MRWDVFSLDIFSETMLLPLQNSSMEDAVALYLLDDQEWAFCTKIGKERNARNQQEKKTNMNYSHRDDDTISIQGVIGEYAFLVLHHLPTDGLEDTTCRNVGTDTFDAVFDNGSTVDVKTTLLTFMH